MRALEITSAILTALAFAWPFSPPTLRPRWMRHLPLAAAGACLLHLTVEGYRWQMLPLYALSLAALVGWAAGVRESSSQRPGRWQSAGSLLGLVLTALASALPVLLPVPTPPAPSGPFTVGTLTFELTDAARPEIYSGRPGEPRRILVQLWYPAEPGPGAQPAAWIEEPDMPRAIARYLGLPAFFLDHTRLARTHAVQGAPPATGATQMPVVLFSHGWSSFRGQSTHQLEELASQGFLVAALQHPYGAILTIFPDGSQAPKNPQALPTGAATDIAESAGNILVDQWAGDMALVLETLSAWHQSDPQGRFTGKLNLERVAVMGHSTGGGATIEFCARDARCKAGIGLDAYLGPVSKAVLQEGLQQPFLYLYSEAWPSARNQELFAQLFSASRGPAYAYTILGTDHYDFSDLPLLTPLASAIGLKGPLPASRVVPILDTMELAFLKQHLLGEPEYRVQGASLLSEPQAVFPEVVPEGIKP